MTNDILDKVKQTPKILIVDDREAERLILTRLLSTFGVELHTAASGQEALAKLIRHEYMLILLDVHMPLMDGLETANYIRANPGTENTPIIFLTAFDTDEINISKGYEAGAIDYLIKPIDEDILLSKVRNFIRSHSFEKEKQYEKILAELENKNEKLNQAREEALQRLEEANRAKAAAQESQQQIEKQTRELIQYTKELEQFAYVATHDLRAPIINLDGIIKIFKKKGYVSNDNRDVVEKMEASVDRINDTLQDLIQVVAYKKSLNDEVREVDLSHLFNNILEDFEVQIRDAGAQIISDFSAAPEIPYIPSHLRSILQNLLSNALKYRAPERTLFITITSRGHNEFVCLSVKDNGMGIDEENKDKVFGLFQRLTSEVQGKGVGLYVTRSQVEALGGAIDFTSKPGEGTEFNVFLKKQAIAR